MLATAGNLVFIGHLDGTFAAYDAKTLQEVWSFNVGSGINAPPITYSVNGKQYVAVLVGSRARRGHAGNRRNSRTRRPHRCCTYSAFSVGWVAT